MEDEEDDEAGSEDMSDNGSEEDQDNVDPFQAVIAPKLSSFSRKVPV